MIDLPQFEPLSTSAQLEMRRIDRKQTEPVRLRCRRVAQTALEPFYQTLPDENSLELYLIRGLTDVLLNKEHRLAVGFPPEFVFLLDAGYESLVGVSVPWSPLGYGDPEFPDFRKASLRSVRSREERDLIFPDVAGSIMIGVKDGTPVDRVTETLTSFGLKDIDLSDNFATAVCTPFQERSICRELERSFDFVKYAGPNHVVRLIDFSPGWNVERLL